MHKKTIFKVKVTNWEKYNANRKKSYRSVMVSERFFDDAKIRTLTAGGKLLFLSCILGASQMSGGYVELSADMIHTYTGLKHKMIGTYLDLLQSLQLVTYEKNEPFIKRNEMKLKEKKRNERKPLRGSKIDRPEAPAQETFFDKPKGEVNRELNRKTWQVYATTYFERWNIEPIRNAHQNSQISNFVKRIGEEAPEVIKFYVGHADSYYVKKGHPLGMAVKDAEALHMQFKKNIQITSTKMRQYEQGQHHNEMIESIRRDGI